MPLADFMPSQPVSHQIPASAAPFFQEYSFSDLDDDKDADLMFDNADRDRQPDLVINLPWYVIRDYFVEQSVILSNRWFRK
jgi:hypothetical protein